MINLSGLTGGLWCSYGDSVGLNMKYEIFHIYYISGFFMLRQLLVTHSWPWYRFLFVAKAIRGKGTDFWFQSETRVQKSEIANRNL